MVYVYAQVNGTKKWRKKDKNSPPLISVTQYCVMEVDRGGGVTLFLFLTSLNHINIIIYICGVIREIRRGPLNFLTTNQPNYQPCVSPIRR